eukprot:15355182-Ditylum_brightwellii.AAC.1
MTSYFSWKTAVSKSKLPPRFTFRYDGLKWDATRTKTKGHRQSHVGYPAHVNQHKSSPGTN